jgi:AraC-like DNA-binding protein
MSEWPTLAGWNASGSSLRSNKYEDPDVHLRDAARHRGVSPDHLNQLLHRFAGTTFHHLISRYRVEKCLELLNEKNYTLTEIYSRCGFNSPTTFDRQFKKWVGCLPSEYKKLVVSCRALAVSAPASGVNN